ncbi:MAG: AEC family transporter [Azospirillaceae bacterium]
MDAILDTVAPVFGLVGMGYGAAKLGWFDESARRGLALFVFNFAIPVLLLRTVATTELPGDLPWGYLISYYGGVAFVFAAAMGLGRVLFAGGLDRLAVLGLGAGFSNTVLLGIPIVLTAFGERAALPLFLLIAFHGLLVLPPATLLIEAGKGRDATAPGRSRGRQAATILGQALKGLATNPIILGLAGGLILNRSGLALPGPVDTIAERLGAAAVPAALFALGAGLARFRIAGAVPTALLIVTLKTAIHPLAVFALAAGVFGLDPLWTGVAVVMAGMPTGINVYLYAQRYDTAVEPVATAIFLGTVVAVVTVSVLLSVFVPTGP